MKPIITALFLIIGLSAFSQKKDSVVVIRSFYDTIKVKIYYEDHDFVKVTQGFQVRQIETNSTKQGGTLLNSTLYDEKWRRFTKTLMAVNQILEK